MEEVEELEEVEEDCFYYRPMGTVSSSVLSFSSLSCFVHHFLFCFRNQLFIDVVDKLRGRHPLRSHFLTSSSRFLNSRFLTRNSQLFWLAFRLFENPLQFFNHFEYEISTKAAGGSSHQTFSRDNSPKY